MNEEPDMTHSQRSYEGLLNEQARSERDERDCPEEDGGPCPECGEYCDEAFEIERSTDNPHPEHACEACWVASGSPSEEFLSRVNNGVAIKHAMESVYPYGDPEEVFADAFADLILAWGPIVVKAAMAAAEDHANTESETNRA